MNKIIYSFVFAAMVATTISCKNGKGGTAAEYTDKSSESASNIIEYTNKVVDMSNDHNKYFDRLTDNVEKIDKALANPNDRYAFMGIMKPFETPSHNFGKVKVEEPVSDLSKEDQKFFKEKVTAYLAHYADLKATYQKMDDYLTAEDYKDDKGAKGRELNDSLKSKITKAYELKSELMKKVETVADASEVVILKDSPVKDYIIAMKGDIKAARELIDLMQENADKYPSVADKVKAQYDALEKAQAEHAKIDIANAKKANKEISYNNFYDRLHDFLLDTKKIMRDAAEKGEITESNGSTLDSDYDSLISSYNSFNS
jgi:hypothetical protein